MGFEKRGDIASGNPMSNPPSNHPTEGKVQRDKPIPRLEPTMTRPFFPLLFLMLLVGCGDPSATAPMLKLTVKSETGSSRFRGRIFHTGLIAASEDGGSTGERSGQRLLIDNITDDGVTLTIESSSSSAEDWKRQVFVPYGEETTVELPNQATIVASLEPRDQ